MPPVHPAWRAARTAHLLGGCRVFNGFDPTVEFLTPTIDGQKLRFKSKKYTSFYAELSSTGVTLIGFEFLTHSLEVKGLVPRNWRTFHPNERRNIWLCNDQMDLWSQISYGASEAGQAELWDLAGRISHQLRVCAWRLYELSDAYYLQLRVRTTEREFKPGERFVDGFTWLGYLAAQVFLVDACVLRDYLAEYVAHYVCPESERPSNRISSMSGLKRHVLKKCANLNPVLADLFTATSAGGWLYDLGAFRDLCIHCVPLARAESSLLALTTETRIEGGQSLFGVSLPLPSDPSGIKKARTSGQRASQVARELQFLTSATRGEVPSSDALAYCHSALDSLAHLASKLAAYSPVSPKIQHLTEKDIIGDVEIRTV